MRTLCADTWATVDRRAPKSYTGYAAQASVSQWSVGILYRNTKRWAVPYRLPSLVSFYALLTPSASVPYLMTKNAHTLLCSYARLREISTEKLVHI